MISFNLLGGRTCRERSIFTGVVMMLVTPIMDMDEELIDGSVSHSKVCIFIPTDDFVERVCSN